MLNKLTKIAAIAFALTLAPVAASAQQQPVSVQSDIMLERAVTSDDGSSATERVTPEVVVPGDRLILGINYHNEGTEAFDNFVVTNPLPGQVMLAADADPRLDVSVDGGRTWGPLAELRVNEGGGVSRTAQHADVTHVRWTLATVQPGESGRLEFPAIIR